MISITIKFNYDPESPRNEWTDVGRVLFERDHTNGVSFSVKPSQVLDMIKLTNKDSGLLAAIADNVSRGLTDGVILTNSGACQWEHAINVATDVPNVSNRNHEWPGDEYGPTMRHKRRTKSRNSNHQ